MNFKKYHIDSILEARYEGVKRTKAGNGDPLICPSKNMILMGAVFVGIESTDSSLFWIKYSFIRDLMLSIIIDLMLSIKISIYSHSLQKFAKSNLYICCVLANIEYLI